MTAADEEHEISGIAAEILHSSISTSAWPKAPIWRSSVSTTPPLRRIRCCPCKRANSVSDCVATAFCATALPGNISTAASPAAKPMLDFKKQRRDSDLAAEAPRCRLGASNCGATVGSALDRSDIYGPPFCFSNVNSPPNDLELFQL